jgi:hypothetical protein
MGNIEIDFFGVPLAVIVTFIFFEYLLFDVFYFSPAILLFLAIILFISGVLFMRMSGRVRSQSKEAYLSVLSSIFIYFAAFEIPMFLGYISLNVAGFIFIVMFLLFVIFQGGSFKNIIINAFIALLLFAKMLFSVKNPTFGYYSAITAVSIILSAFIVYKFSRRKMFFEKAFFAQVVLSVSIIIMLWGVARLVK